MKHSVQTLTYISNNSTDFQVQNDLEYFIWNCIFLNNIYRSTLRNISFVENMPTLNINRFPFDHTSDYPYLLEMASIVFVLLYYFIRSRNEFFFSHFFKLIEFPSEDTY